MGTHLLSRVESGRKVNVNTDLHLAQRLIKNRAASVLPSLFSCFSKRQIYSYICKWNLIFVDPCITVQFIQKNPTRCNSVSKFLLFLILNEVKYVSGDTPPIIRSLKLHMQPLVFHNTVEGYRTRSCWTLSGSVRYLITSNNCTSNNLPHMQNQRLPVQF
jgi:hypothetical protein